MIGAVIGSFFHYMKVGPSEVHEDEPETHDEAHRELTRADTPRDA